MANQRSDGWETNRTVYTERQIERVLTALGIEIRDETENDFISFCPYHGNRSTPAFTTSKRYGVSTCFNPSCDIGGHFRIVKGKKVESKGVSLEQLVRDIEKTGPVETKRFILEQRGDGESVTYLDRLREAQAVVPDFVEFDKAYMLPVWYDKFWESQKAQDYMMQERGFTEETLRFFEIGYSPGMDMVAVPMHDPTGQIPIGIIGRTPSVDDKTFKNSPRLPKSKTMWNLHRARRYETVIVVEASFDAMRVHQAGYPNVVALLGGSLSPAHETLFKRHFSKVIIMTDDDPVKYEVDCRKCIRQGHKICQGHQPGRVLGQNIVDKLPGLQVSWAAYDDFNIYANGVKDAGEMTDEEIRQCLRNAVSNFEYHLWRG